VGVTDVAALDDSNDVFACAEFAFLRLHAENAGVGASECVEDLLRSAGDWARRKILQQKAFTDSAALIESCG
jgi:hypothetical protein